MYRPSVICPSKLSIISDEVYKPPGGGAVAVLTSPSNCRSRTSGEPESAHTHTMAESSWFSNVDAAKPIEVFALTAAYNEDPHPNKVNLGVGGKWGFFHVLFSSRTLVIAVW